MPDQLELNWLVQERPQPLPLDAATTARVRSDLLERRDRGARESSRRPRSLHRLAWRGFAGSVTLAGVAAAALAVVSASGQTGAGALARSHPKPRDP